MINNAEKAAMTINDGTFKETVSNKDGTMTIVGGTFEGDVENSDIIDISGGAFTQESTAELLDDDYALLYDEETDGKASYIVIPNNDSAARLIYKAMYKWDNIYYTYYNDVLWEAPTITTLRHRAARLIRAMIST